MIRKLSCLLRDVHRDMKTIMTVCGPIPADKIGLTSMHDHILAALSFFKHPITDDIEKDSQIDLDSSIDMKNLCYLRNGLAEYCRDNWNLTDRDATGETLTRFFSDAFQRDMIAEALKNGARSVLKVACQRLITRIREAEGIQKIAKNTIFLQEV